MYRAALFLNPAKTAVDFYYRNNGVFQQYPAIGLDTMNDLPADHYAKERVRVIDRKNTDSRKLQNNHTVGGGSATKLHDALPIDGGAAAGQHGQQHVQPDAAVAVPRMDAEAAGDDAVVQNAPNGGVHEGVDAVAGDGPVNPNVAEAADAQNPMGNQGGIGFGAGAGLGAGAGAGGGVGPGADGMNPGMGGGGFFNTLRQFSLFKNFWSKNNDNNEHVIDKDDHISSQAKILIENAKKANTSESYLRLANSYIMGLPNIGLQPDLDKAMEFYDISAEMGSPLAQYNVAVLNQKTNITRSRDLFEK